MSWPLSRSRRLTFGDMLGDMLGDMRCSRSIDAYKHSQITAWRYQSPPPIAGPLKLSQTTNVPTRFRRVSDLGRLTNRFFLKDRCALPDQMSFSLARSWRAFVLAKKDRRGANKNEITIFVFSITAKDFSHGELLDGKGRSSSCRKLDQRAGRRQFGFP